MMKRFACLSMVSAVLVMSGAGLATQVDAATVTLDTTRFGIYEAFASGGNPASFSHSPNTGSLQRYDVGSSFSDSASQTFVQQRDYFVFDLSGVTGNVTGATLRLFSPGAPTSTHPTDTLAISDVTTPITTLTNSPEGAGSYGSIFDDLGTGTQYGTATLDPTAIAAGTQINVALINALSDINAQKGGSFAVGGSINPLNLIDGGGPYYLNGGTFPPNAQLILQTDTNGTVVPEPSSVLLVLTGAGGLAAWRWARLRSTLR